MEAAKEWVLMGEEGFLCRDGWSAVAKYVKRLDPPRKLKKS